MNRTQPSDIHHHPDGSTTVHLCDIDGPPPGKAMFLHSASLDMTTQGIDVKYVYTLHDKPADQKGNQ